MTQTEGAIQMGHSGPNKISNEYADLIPEDIYAATPKSVFAAIAISALMDGDPWHRDKGPLSAELVKEWDTLHVQGIVPQPVPPRFRPMIDEARGM